MRCFRRMCRPSGHVLPSRGHRLRLTDVPGGVLYRRLKIRSHGRPDGRACLRVWQRCRGGLRCRDPVSASECALASASICRIADVLSLKAGQGDRLCSQGYPLHLQKRIDGQRTARLVRGNRGLLLQNVPEFIDAFQHAVFGEFIDRK